MARIDKYESMTGGFRALLGFTPVTADLEKPLVVGLDANGRVVKGPGNTGLLGILVLTEVLNVGAAVDVMQDGELVELTGLTAGTRYFAVSAADGALNTTNTGVPVGHTVEADRLVVRFARTRIGGAGA